jgi:hypothetical protein
MVFVRDSHLGELDLRQQIQLKQQRARRVFFLYLGEYIIPEGSVRQRGQVFAVPPAHELLTRRVGTLDQIRP